ncbi:Protein transport protein Sec16B [Morus notabilis]|uniref:Protein transport protein sec16 n=1 Tax=Morus notabilis TaxID=981085 RepID=W9S9N5_9ROSA|nr:protein transport protein SEC16B homolog isoform X2 [Morus notabilis]EXC32401.1 Protein transport protein Sec16B [Morus notabilis]
MASSPFEAEDQTDEDFFDRLVNDDDDIGFTVSTFENKLSNLSISGVESSRVDSSQDFGISPDLGAKEKSDSLVQESENETKKESEFDGEEGKSEVSESGKVKVVQWDSFNSDSNLHGGSGFGSFSDLFGAVDESSEDPFANVDEGDKSWVETSVKDGVADLGSSGLEQNREDQYSGNSQEQNWENLYPGWKYDPNTGQWYLVESYDVNANQNDNLNSSAAVQESFNLNSQHSVLKWNQMSQVNNTQYPAHMVFDPQYPGWYYDTISQEWKVLESYSQAAYYSQGVEQNDQYRDKNANYRSQDVGSQEGIANVNANVWQTQQAAQSVTIGYAGSQQLGNRHVLKDHGNQQTGLGSVSLYENSSQGFDGGNVGFQNVDDVGNFSQIDNQVKEEKYQEMHFSPQQFDGQKAVFFAQQSLQSGTSFSYSSSEERTSARRPPHALVTFGFGGKLIVMKDANSVQANSAYGSQDSRGAVISILNMMDVFADKTDTSGFETGGRDYFRALCQQSFPGPLVGGNAGSKELNKWVDEKIASYGAPYMDFRKADLLRLLFSLLKIALQYYGKFRSPFGTDQVLKENDSPESAVAKLFASAKRNQEDGAFRYCLQNIPSEGQIQATALEVQKLLVSGRKKDALEYAQEGQLWGPALVLASQLGDQFYSDTVKKMAVKQLIAGSPLRTLCLLIAGQPADVFSNATTQSSLASSLNVFQQPAQVKANYTLDEWTDNLAIITANRTKDDELVIIHLGDCLWKETGDITAAHICYLVAEANFEPHMDGARLCLIGADHWKFPRTYASPEAIQPYKLIYAHMLAEVGKISDALKYCQAILKSLKTGRAPEVEMWRQLVLSLEERIKTHQQGGYGTNLAQKLRTFFDNTATRVVGGLPPPVPSTPQGGAQPIEYAQQLGGPRVSNSQSTMAMSSLMPSASLEPISERTGESDNKTKHNRSISEPDFSRNPQKDEKSSNAQERTLASSGSRFGSFGSQLFQKTVGLVIRSRPNKQAKLGEPNSFYYDEKLKRWVEKGTEPPPEETALAPPPTTAAFQSGIQDYSMENSPKPERFDPISGPEIKSPNSSEKSPGTPPIPPSSNQFSARGRMGVRSRYVDTFNKGGGTATNIFHSPSTPAAKPVGGSNPKFFIPAPITSSEETVQTGGESFQDATMNNSDSSTLTKEDSSSSTTQTSVSMMAMQRFPSMDTIVSKPGEMGKDNSSLPPNSRRTVSWSGSFTDARSPPMMKEIKPLGEALDKSPSLYAPNDPPALLPRNSGSFGVDLHEVQL